MKLLEIARHAYSLLVIVWKLAVQQAADAGDKRAKSDNGAKEPSPQITVWSEVHLPPGLVEEYRAAERAKKQRDNLLARISLLSVLVVVGYTVVSFRQLGEIHQQGAIAETNLRPWIKIQSIDLRPGVGPIKTLMFHSPLSRAESEPFLQLRAVIVNVGHSVAEDVQVIPNLYFGRFVEDKWHDVISAEEARYCASLRSGTPSGSAAVIVFPSDSWEYLGGTGAVSPMQGDAAAVILCVNYRGAPGTRYQTQALAGLYSKGRTVIPIGVDADAADLRLIRDPWADRAK